MKLSWNGVFYLAVVLALIGNTLQLCIPIWIATLMGTDTIIFRMQDVWGYPEQILDLIIFTVPIVASIVALVLWKRGKSTSFRGAYEKENT